MNKSEIISRAALHLRIFNFRFVSDVENIVFFRSIMAVKLQDILETIPHICKYYKKDCGMVLFLELGLAYGYVRFVCIGPEKLLQKLTNSYGGYVRDGFVWILFDEMNTPRGIRRETIDRGAALAAEDIHRQMRNWLN